MTLTSENYFSRKVSQIYSGASEFKSFFGTLVRPGCEARALAEFQGKWQREMSTALLVGSYVDAHYEGTLDLFKAQHPEIFLKGGGLKAEYRQADEIISFLEQDPKFSQYMSGEKQVIMTGEIEGVPFKIKIDSWHPGKMIVDLKVMASLTKREFVRGVGRVSFVNYWGYDIQGAIYQEIVRQNTGERLPFFIAGASKEKQTNKELIWIDDNSLDIAMEWMTSEIVVPSTGEVVTRLKRLSQLKSGQANPERCGKCDYCRATKMLTGPVHYMDLEEE
ncbi:MAG: PD-(D/E)XK nuclease-like domain-containing protein [Bacillota bacterium]|nr:PD-(D/E)XK nuclease-like domain-containing protein [Bacillota bacterium]